MEGSDLLTLSVSAERATRLRDAFSELRRAKPSSDEALVWLERLIADLEKAQSGAVDLTAPRGLLHEGILVTIDEIGDGLSERCTDLLRGAGSPTEIRGDVRGLDELLDLLAAIDRND